MSSNPPKVTVLALAYNHSRYLSETLDSIRDQTFQDFELFVSDDASQDDSAALIQQWNAEHQRADRLFLHERNIGLCPTLNELLSHASGEYLQFIACDDHLLPRSLEQRVAALDQCGPETAAIYSDALRMDESGNEVAKTFLQRFLKKKPVPTGDLYSYLLLGNFLPAMSV
ncbi:MAG: glycosyltransferase family 2 protein, partial [Bythopirellula sp.]